MEGFGLAKKGTGPVDYVKIVRKLNRPGLNTLWKNVRDGTTPAPWSAGKALEHVVLRAFELESVDVVWPYDVRVDGLSLEQVDGTVYFKHFAALVEAKDYHYTTSMNVDYGPIAKLKSQLGRRPAGTVGLIFSTNGFTAPAKTLARHSPPANVLLWEGPELEYALKKGKMVSSFEEKLRHAVEHGFPDYNILAGAV